MSAPLHDWRAEAEPHLHYALSLRLGPGQALALTWAGPGEGPQDAARTAARDARTAFVVAARLCGRDAPALDEIQAYDIRAVHANDSNYVQFGPAGVEALGGSWPSKRRIDADRVDIACGSGLRAAASRALLPSGENVGLCYGSPRQLDQEHETQLAVWLEIYRPGASRAAAPDGALRDLAVALTVAGYLSNPHRRPLWDDVPCPASATLRATLARQLAGEAQGHARQAADFLRELGLDDHAAAFEAAYGASG